jgi:coproporphyrinogen III oxidase-like Fe-S oxidoreductase
VSLYQLTLEPGTRFFDDARRGRLTLPSGDEAADLYEATAEQCGAAGFRAYEVSNYAKAGEECRHNLVYWRSGDWAGVGPGAHGRRTGGHVRTATRAVRSPERWIEAAERGSGSEPDEVLDDASALREFVLMGLRLSEGLDAERFRARTGRDLGSALSPARESLFEAGLVDWDGVRLWATPKGRLVLNSVIKNLLGAAEREAA